MNRETIFSPCRKWRYTLWREWDSKLPFVQFIGLNPSTADEKNNDPTITRCIDFSKRWGYGALCMTNIFAWRDTLPKNMKTASEPIGADNDKWLSEIYNECRNQHVESDLKVEGIVIAAWGNEGKHLYRSIKVRRMLTQLHCLGITTKGEPNHPLYLPAVAIPIPLKERT